MLVTREGMSKNGWTAISWVTEAVRGEGRLMEIAYMESEYIRLKVGETFFPKSNIVPCNLACATMPKIGINTAEVANPKVTSHHHSPDLKPNNGGRIRFPAPKNREKRANVVIRISLFLSIGMNFGER